MTSKASTEVFSVVGLGHNAWYAAERRHPVVVLWPPGALEELGAAEDTSVFLWPYGRIANPDGRRKPELGSAQFVMACIAFSSIRLYTNREHDLSEHISCRTSLLL